ncbi:hypothetical protein ES703_71263 [subsurface metagenome]
MIGKVKIILMRKQVKINKNRLFFFSYFVITTPHPLNLIKDIIIDTVLQGK